MCVFSDNLAVLVNSCPTQELSIQRGLKQGGPLAPFHFLLVAKGLSRLFSRVVDQCVFSGLHRDPPMKTFRWISLRAISFG